MNKRLGLIREAIFPKALNGTRCDCSWVMGMVTVAKAEAKSLLRIEQRKREQER